MLKVCCSCKKRKPRSAFYPRRENGRVFVRSSCKKCENAGRKKWCTENRERYNASRKRYHTRAPAIVMLVAARKRARAKGLQFSITANDLSFPETCPVLGIPMRRESGKHSDNSYTLDRIRNEDGYIPGNVLVVSRRANVLKRDATPDEIRRLFVFYAGEGTRAEEDHY